MSDLLIISHDRATPPTRLNGLAVTDRQQIIPTSPYGLSSLIMCHNVQTQQGTRRRFCRVTAGSEDRQDTLRKVRPGSPASRARPRCTRRCNGSRRSCAAARTWCRSASMARPILNRHPPTPTNMDNKQFTAETAQEFHRRMAAIIDAVQAGIWQTGVHALLGYATDYAFGQERGLQTLVLKTGNRSSYVRL